MKGKKVLVLGAPKFVMDTNLIIDANGGILVDVATPHQDIDVIITDSTKQGGVNPNFKGLKLMSYEMYQALELFDGVTEIKPSPGERYARCLNRLGDPNDYSDSYEKMTHLLDDKINGGFDLDRFEKALDLLEQSEHPAPAVNGVFVKKTDADHVYRLINSFIDDKPYSHADIVRAMNILRGEASND